MQPLEYVRLYAGPDGESHVQHCGIGFSLNDFAPPAPALGVSPNQAARSCRFLNLPAGWTGELHVSPARQWLFLLRGEMHFEASDGERYVAAAGSAILLEDTHGRGHRSWIPATGTALIAAVAIEPPAGP